MDAPLFQYVDRWRVQGRIEDVADILADGAGYAHWWPSTYLDVRVTQPGNAHRIGEVGVIRAKGWLPYTIEFTGRVVENRYPHGYTLETVGEFSGRGTWTIDADGPWVNATFHWAVRGHKPLWRWFTFLLRPIFESNHRWTMRRGEESLRLELARRRARTQDERDSVPLPPGPVPSTPWDIGREVLDVLCIAGPGRPLRVQHSATIARPVEEVFAYVAQPENDLAWQPEIREVHITTPPPLREGSQFREVRRTFGRTFVWGMVVTALEPYVFVCIESTAGTPRYRGCRHFEAAEGGTRITETSEIELAPLLWPFRGLLARMSVRPVAAAYRKLKALLEAA
jgi:hypothetical protein